ncbi:MAG: VWA domain-containing protein [Acidobacteria bacterium]|nr:VWA domain-containing protein [Acidobacteriota bacterium]
MVSAPLTDSAPKYSSSMPISLAIIFDLSQSTNEYDQSPTVKPKDLKSLLSQLFQLSSQNQYFIIGVSTKPTIILNGSTDIGVTLKALSKIASIRREGATALYDACYLGIEKITQREPSNRVLLVVSDGVDTMSDKSLNEVKRALVEKKVKLYAIIGMSTNNVYKGVLDDLASISGGGAFHYKQSKDLGVIMERLVAKLQE